MGGGAAIVAKSANLLLKEAPTMSQSTAAPPAGPEKHYHDQLAQGRFQIQRCQACSQAVFYPRMVCPHCGSGQLDWIQPSGKGRSDERRGGKEWGGTFGDREST